MSAQALPLSVQASAIGTPIDSSHRINVHFQPDLPYESITVIESLAKTKQYHSQFKTGISNGGMLDASGRAEWESNLFRDFYRGTDKTSERPKYGSLNIFNDQHGSSPRFGSCFFRLTQAVLGRTTFAFPESSLGPKAMGTADRFSNIDILARETCMEEPLNWYIEAHIHGELLIPKDVETVVLDPSYKGTYVEDAVRKLDCEVEWHDGYVVEDVEMLRLHGDYRGKKYVGIAEQLADENGKLNPEILGRAYRTSNFDRQEIKKVWHYLARYGRKTLWPQMSMGA